TWKAKCADRAVQDRLTLFTVAFGQIQNLRRSEFPETEIPMSSRLLSAQRSAGLPPVPDQREFTSQTIHGRILICPDLFSNHPRAGSMFPDRTSALADAKAKGLKTEDIGEATYVVLDKAELHGADFRIFDPRNLYPGSDRMSFVFVSGTG